MKKFFAVLLVLAVLPVGAFACTAIYAGSALTSDGSMIFARLEELSSEESWPKKKLSLPLRSACCYRGSSFMSDVERP